MSKLASGRGESGWVHGAVRLFRNGIRGQFEGLHALGIGCQAVCALVEQAAEILREQSASIARQDLKAICTMLRGTADEMDARIEASGTSSLAIPSTG